MRAALTLLSDAKIILFLTLHPPSSLIAWLSFLSGCIRPPLQQLSLESGNLHPSAETKPGTGRPCLPYKGEGYDDHDHDEELARYGERRDIAIPGCNRL